MLKGEPRISTNDTISCDLLCDSECLLCTLSCVWLGRHMPTKQPQRTNPTSSHPFWHVYNTDCRYMHYCAISPDMANCYQWLIYHVVSQIARFMRPTWGPSGAWDQPGAQIARLMGTIWGPSGAWDQPGAHLGPTRPRWAPCWLHELW